MRLGFIAGAMLVLTVAPSLATAQATSLAYQPSAAAVRLASDARLPAPQDTVETYQDPYAAGSNSVVTGAVIGGIIGATVVALQTAGATGDDTVPWAAAATAPIIGGLLGAGIGLLFR